MKHKKKPNGDLAAPICTRLTVKANGILRKQANEMNIPLSTYLRIWIERTLKIHSGLPALELKDY